MDTGNRQVAIVVPTIREKCAQEFLKAWDFQVPVYLVEDNPDSTFEPGSLASYHVKYYNWHDIDRVLGADSWIIPRRSDCIRSFGFLMAYEDGADVIITMDDDCLPFGGMEAELFIDSHLDMLDYRPFKWVSTVGSDGRFTPRGVPYQNRGEIEVVLNMGGWWRNPDLDGPQSLAWLRRPGPSYEMYDWYPVPAGRYFPMCGMNLAFDTKIMPLMYFLLMGQNAEGEPYPYDRFGDIWCGIIAKKILDTWGYAVCSGSPLVDHIKASNPLANLVKETPGLLVNEWLWRKIDNWTPYGNTLAENYISMAHQLGRWAAHRPPAREYWLLLKSAMLGWVAWTEGIRKGKP